MMMITTQGWTAKRVRVLLLAGGLLGGGAAHADSYNILLKSADGAAVDTCVTGGFSFTKTGAGTFATTGGSVTLTNCPFVPAIANGAYSPGTLQVVVENVGQSGPNVVGLTGTLVRTTSDPGNCDGSGNSGNSKTYTITFSYAANSQNAVGRTYTLVCTSGPGNFTTGTRRYHVFNTNTVPEPGQLWLVLGALGALFAVQRLRRR